MPKRIKEPKRVYPATRDIGTTWSTNDFFKFEVATVKNLTPNSEIHVCLTPAQGLALSRQLVGWLTRLQASDTPFNNVTINLESHPRFQTAPSYREEGLMPEFVHKKRSR